ncbi:metallophosphoesterase family protein [Actinomarinicola tropica]|uniref:metallophosphoesterase family protein n=1 Tax=Actinomarinicola tropica TaxID=2789776 RepID=UPI00189887BC|nr:metallophosphoesterase [Actinomarinicola tropica]
MEVVAVEPTALQVTWVGLPSGPVEVAVEPQRGAARRLLRDSDGGPGGVVVDDLAPATPLVLRVAGRRFDLRTPQLPAGEELCRFATVSDVHLGNPSVGIFHTMRERDDPVDPHPLRCGRAAIREARGWGAELLVVKGDLVEHGHPEQWDMADALLADAGVPVTFVPGNHEVKRSPRAERRDVLDGAEVELVRGVAHRDLPGLRLVLVDTTIDGRGHGAVRHLVEEVADVVADASGPTVVAMHHYAQRFQLPWFWPPGIPGREARRFLDALVRANPATLVTSGHTHRNRARRHGPLVVTEVGSTKDFPGVWGGYVVHEGGIRQTVRRTLDRSAMGWTEYTRRAVGGIWGRWSMGDLDDRCISHDWDR